MSISTTAMNARSSERFMLVRLTPARYVVDDLSSAGGGIYTMTFNFPIAKVERNGGVLTETTTNPPGSNDQWYHDESAGTFKVKLASAPSSTTNVIVIYYYLFYTNHRAREAYETPTDSATTARDWEPRLISMPTISQSIRNVTSGVFSIASTGVELINSDYAFQQYLTVNDSFNKKDVDIWLCVDTTADMQYVFQGKVDSINLTEDRVSVLFLDNFAKLDSPAFMGDAASEAYFTRSAFASLDPNKEGGPCKYVAGTGNRHTYSYIQSMSGIIYDGRPFSGETAACTSYASASTSTNRTWGFCRVPTGISNQSFGSIVRVTNGFGVSLTIAQVNSHTYEVGETVKWTEAAVTYYGLVLRADSFTYSGNSYNLAISCTDGTFTTSSTLIAIPKIAVGVSGGGLTYPRYIQYDNFTVNSTTTTGSNKYISVTFNNNFEAASLGGETLDPAIHTVYFRVCPSADSGHESVLKRMVEAAGLTANAASFTSAGGSLDMDCQFTIPYFDELEYGTYIDYAEDLLSCTLGALYQNTSQEVAYALFDAPSAGSTIDRNIYLRDSFSARVDYSDIVTQIVAYNPHATDEADLDSANSSSATAESVKAKYLHGAKTTRFRHIMTSLANRISSILAVRSTRRVLYSFETASANLNTLIGDNLTLETDAVLGTSGTSALTVVSIDNGGDSTTIEATDLEEL